MIQKAEKKYPCEDCAFCQFCSDSRCNMCRGGPDNKKKCDKKKCLKPQDIQEKK